MNCKHCNYPDTRVVQTNFDDKVNYIYRRRECLKCKERFTTAEHFRDDYDRKAINIIKEKSKVYSSAKLKQY